MCCLLRWCLRSGRGLLHWILTPSAGGTAPASRIEEPKWCHFFTVLSDQRLNLDQYTILILNINQLVSAILNLVHPQKQKRELLIKMIN